jgi:hypothetical protein
MISDTQMQVWLDSTSGPPTIVAPYVRTDEDAHLAYRIKVNKTGKSGSSRIDQSGEVTAAAGTPKELSRFAIAVNEGDRCEVEIEMLEGGQVRARYRFDCPR